MPPSRPATEIAADLEKAIGYLSHLPGVRRIWLFGSAAKGRRLDWRSDLDLAVEGLAAADLAKAWSELDARLELPLDLVRWEEASATLKAEIRRTGRLLFGEDVE